MALESNKIFKMTAIHAVIKTYFTCHTFHGDKKAKDAIVLNVFIENTQIELIEHS